MPSLDGGDSWPPLTEPADTCQNGTSQVFLCVCSLQNWMKNSLKVHNESILEQVWSIFSEASGNVSQI